MARREPKTMLERELEREDLTEVSVQQVIMGPNGPVDTSRRIYVNVWDVDHNFLRAIPVPFGLVDIAEPYGGYPAALRFGLLMLERHSPELAVLDTREATDDSDAAVLVADRGPS